MLEKGGRGRGGSVWTQQRGVAVRTHSSWIYKRLLHYICSLLLCAESPSQKKMKLRYLEV